MYKFTAPGEAITLEQMITITENCDPGSVITFSLDMKDSKATTTTVTNCTIFSDPYNRFVLSWKLQIFHLFLYTMDTVESPVKQ